MKYRRSVLNAKVFSDAPKLLIVLVRYFAEIFNDLIVSHTVSVSPAEESQLNYEKREQLTKQLQQNFGEVMLSFSPGEINIYAIKVCSANFYSTQKHILVGPRAGPGRKIEVNLLELIQIL